MRLAERLLGLGAVVALAAATAAPSVLAAGHAVSIHGFAFDPASITVAVGDSVTWTNNDGSTHTATGDGGSFDAGTIAAGASQTVVFSIIGTYPYRCKIHSNMTGTVTVAKTSLVSQAPTDVVSPAPGPTDDPPFAVVLAILGVTMLAGTVIADRRYRQTGG